MSVRNLNMTWSLVNTHESFLRLSPAEQKNLSVFFFRQALPFYEAELQTSPTFPPLIEWNKKYIQVVLNEIQSRLEKSTPEPTPLKPAILRQYDVYPPVRGGGSSGFGLDTEPKGKRVSFVVGNVATVATDDSESPADVLRQLRHDLERLADMTTHMIRRVDAALTQDGTGAPPPPQAFGDEFFRSNFGASMLGGQEDR